MQVLKSGLLDTIQDLGRYGYQHTGINPGGAMDTVAAQVANFLVGNSGNTAVLELHYPAASLLWEEDTIFALAGADFGAMINDQPIPVNTPIVVSKYTVLQFTRLIKGARCYLAVQGGFAVQPWLNSYSTNLKVKAGGLDGHALQKGNSLSLGFNTSFGPVLKEKDFIHLHWTADMHSFYHNGPVRLTEGRHFPLLEPESKKQFLGGAFSISQQSDRMGYRLSGNTLETQHDTPLLSAPVTRGTIQLLPEGQLIVLMADHQTTGGYPMIAHVTSADLPVLAQLQPNEQVHFSMIPLAEAEELAGQQHRHLQLLENACKLQLQAFLSA